MNFTPDPQLREWIHDGLVEIMESAGVPLDSAAKIRETYDRRDYPETVELLTLAVGDCRNRESSGRLNYIADIIKIAHHHNGI